MTVKETDMAQTTATLTTESALNAVAYGRAPGGRVNEPIRCADGFTVSVQASPRHYAIDSDGKRPYWSTRDEPTIAYPFVSFEIGYPSENPIPSEVWDEYDSGGVWAWVPRAIVADLLDAHGGAVAWGKLDPCSI